MEYYSKIYRVIFTHSPFKRKARAAGFFSEKSDKKLIDYTFDLHGNDITRGELQKKDSRLCLELKKRGLIDKIKTIRRVGGFMNFEEWKNYGIKREYNKINPISLAHGQNNEERSWYARGSYMRKEKWLKRFPFKRKRIEGRWRTYNEWKNYGMNRGYNELSPVSLEKSEDREDRSWYSKGTIMKKEKWLSKFHFKRKIISNRWKTYDEWLDYGLKKKYDSKNPGSLIKSENKDERRWYQKGNDMNKKEKWLERFTFSREIKISGYYKNFENFEREMLEAIEENDGLFPIQREFVKMGRGSLNQAMYSYYGGKYAVMERIGYNEAKIQELASELEEILKEI